MDGEQKRGNEGGKTASHFRSNHENLVVFYLKGSHLDYVQILSISLLSFTTFLNVATCAELSSHSIQNSAPS
jgi:hypothetical protein